MNYAVDQERNFYLWLNRCYHFPSNQASCLDILKETISEDVDNSFAYVKGPNERVIIEFEPFQNDQKIFYNKKKKYNTSLDVNSLTSNSNKYTINNPDVISVVLRFHTL